MVERLQRLKQEKKGGGVYYDAPSSDLRFVKSGCTLLDCVMGGGIVVLGRMTNIIGDKSTGKTLLAIEACANFLRDYPNGKIYYREAEAAFDKPYAQTLGMPIDDISFIDDDDDFDTVEDFYEDLEAILDKLKSNQPALYILDSLDSLSSRAEMGRKIDQASFGDGKAKQMSQLFRRLVRKMKKKQLGLIIVSQIRDNIGVMFGEKHTRSGGHAMNFYASQIVKLAHIKTLTQTIRGQKRATAIRIKAKCTKNKVGVAQRACEFTLRFSYGTESYVAGMEWLIEVGRTKELGLSKDKAGELMEQSADWDSGTYHKRSADLDKAVKKVWNEIETDLLPTRRKYVDGF